MKVFDYAKDLMDGLGYGTIIEVYTNHHGDQPETMYVVDFGNDNVFDRLVSELEPAQIITIPEDELKLLQGWLDECEQVPDAGETETLKRYTATFPNGIEVDIKVVNSDCGPYVDAVMFEDGCEIGFLDIRDTLVGVYEFTDEDEDYMVVVKSA